MTTQSASFATQRLTLDAGESTPIFPNFGQTVLIANHTTTDLFVYSAENDESTYFTIAAGWDHVLRVSSFQIGQIAFWLKSSVGGTVTLIWA